MSKSGKILPNTKPITNLEYIDISIHDDTRSYKLEDLTILMRSPDLLNNVKIVQDQLQLIILFYGGCGHLVK